MATEVLTVTGRPMPLDLLLFRRFKREVPGLVESTYARNPGLADLGPELPINTQVTVEMPAPANSVAARKIVTLF